MLKAADFNTMSLTYFTQWHNQASTAAGGAADQIGYSGEKDSRLWICASRTGRKKGMPFLCRISFEVNSFWR